MTDSNSFREDIIDTLDAMRVDGEAARLVVQFPDGGISMTIGGRAVNHVVAEYLAHNLSPDHAISSDQSARAVRLLGIATLHLREHHGCTHEIRQWDGDAQKQEPTDG